LENEKGAKKASANNPTVRCDETQATFEEKDHWVNTFLVA
jgi:hypothetical protein